MSRWVNAVAGMLTACLVQGCILSDTPGVEIGKLPPPVIARERPLADYDDRLLTELGMVVADPGLPSTGRVLVVCSPKVELMFIVAGLASEWALWSPGSAGPGELLLRRAAKAHFLPYRDHPAVRALARLRRRTGFWYDALPHLAFAYSDPPALEQVYPLSPYLVGRAGGDERALRELMAHLKDFAAASAFAGWWEDNEDGYRLVEAFTRQALAATDPLGRLEDYFGQRLGALVIIPSGMIRCGFGGRLETPRAAGR